MLPALRPGILILGYGRYRELRRGDIIVLRHGGLEKIKRIAQINGDRLFVRGDNDVHSVDSRSFGWLHTSVVVAKVIWPRQ
jgi:phage repressor protein C with HTH and peptisase S24 domain